MRKLNINKFILALSMVSAFSVSSVFPIWAGEWEQKGEQWKYKKDSGSYATEEWMLISNEFYYFNADGWMLSSTVTEDGYSLNGSGALIEELTENRPWSNESEAHDIGKEIQAQKGWKQNPIRIESNSASYGNSTSVVELIKTNGGYDLTLKTRLSGTSATGTQAICSLTGISNLYDIIYDSFEGNNSNGINYDTPVTIGNHTYLAINEGSSIIYQIR